MMQVLTCVCAAVVVGGAALVGGGVNASGDGPEKAADAERALEGLSWMSGAWSGSQWGGEFTAYYSTPAGGRVLGHSVLIRDGEEAFYEFEVFGVVGEEVRMTPYPGGKRAEGFRMVSNEPTAQKIVFENPGKDFPTRVTYWMSDEKTLAIRLDDPHGGTGKREEFSLTRQ